MKNVPSVKMSEPEKVNENILSVTLFYDATVLLLISKSNVRFS